MKKLKCLLCRLRNVVIARQLKRKLEATRDAAKKLKHHDKCSCSNCTLNAMYETSYLRRLKQLEKAKQV